ncbi:glycerophosphodiester phosphodiesterase, partial [Escherichia coli]
DVKYLAIDQALQLGCCQIGWMDELASKDIIRTTQAAALSISVWTVNDVTRAKELRDWGIQGLITDYPKLMMQQL